MTDSVDPPGGTGRPDPAAARTPAEFVETMRRLKRWSGLGFRRLAQRAAAAGNALPRSTLTAVLSRDTLPREDLVAAFARTCGCDDGEVERWVAACRRIAARTVLPAPPSPPPGGVAPAVVPAQLPPAVAGFVGRAHHLEELDALLASDGTGQPPPVVISAIAGTAGIGKTALAVHWAHRVAGRFPDGQLYVNLRGFDPSGVPTEPAAAIRGFLDALEVPTQRIPADLDAQTALYRSLLAGKHILVVLDNARDAGQVRPLLPGAPGCLAVVTSRNQLTSLVAAEGARPLILDLLSTVESRELLARRLGPVRVAAEREAVDEIITWCVRLPLALAIAAARAATRPDLTLAALAAEMRETRTRLDAFDTGDTGTDVRAVFSWSYQRLGTASARLFRLLGLHPGPDISAPAAASLAGVSPPDVRPLLAELTRTHLISEPTPGRYAFHDLLRAYAADLAGTIDGDQHCRAATHRFLDHYRHTAFTAARLLNPHRDPISLTPPQPGTRPEKHAGHGPALAWFSAEYAVLLAAIDHAAGAGWDAPTWELAWTIFDFLDLRGYWHDQVTTQVAAVAAARRLADPSMQALAHRLLAFAYLQLGRLDDAGTDLRHALDLYRQAGDHTGQAHAQQTLARMKERQGSYAEALDHGQQALDLYRAAGHRRGQGLILNGIGWLHAQLGDHQQALTACQQALTLLQEIGDPDGQANTWDSLGYIHHHLGNHAEAIDCYRHALHLFHDLGNRYPEAIILDHLGDAHHAAGNLDDSQTDWQRALTILDELEHPDAEQMRAKLKDADRPETRPNPGRP